MILGLDFYGTVTKDAKTYRKLVSKITEGGGAVHLISHILPNDPASVERDIHQTHIKFSGVHIVQGEWHEAPRLKLDKCKELGIEMFVDDREDTLRLLQGHGIIVLRAI